MLLRDAHGNVVSAASRRAVEAVDLALWRMMSFYGTPLDDLDAAIATDPAWLLPRAMKAGFLLSLTEPSLLDEARSLLGDIGPLLTGANDRERAHVAALRWLAAGEWQAASEAWRSLLEAHPRDALALQWLHLFDFYRGDAAGLHRHVADALPAWQASDPLHPYLLGLHAFGLEETGRYDEAEAVGREALAGAARVPWAIHAVAHVMEMQGRHDEGGRWMERWRGDWAEGNGFVCHLAWHEALFALERLDHAAALAVFDRYLNPGATEIALQRVDAASLLWRLELQGADVGDRWRALCDGWVPSGGGGADGDGDSGCTSAGHSTFNDLHALLALAGCGDLDRAAAWIETSLRRAEQAGGWNGTVSHDLGGPLMRGFLAFASGRFDAAADAITSVRTRAARFGGSHAQRDMIDQTLLAAAARGDRKAAGIALLDQRLRAKPRTPLSAWWAQSLGVVERDHGLLPTRP